MANLHIENFGHGSLVGIYQGSVPSVANGPAGRAAGTLAMSGSTALLALPNTITSFHGFALNPASITVENTIYEVLDNGTVQVQITVDASGRIRAYRGPRTTLLGQSAVNAVYASAWQYIEVKTVIDPVAGAVQVRLNSGGSVNNVVLDLSAQNTRNTANTFIDQAKLVMSGFWYGRDWYINDDAGVAPNNTYWGDINVWTRMPNGDGATSAWTVSSGASAHFSYVDENPDNGDTDYLFTSGVGNIELFTYEDVPGSGVIYAAEHRLNIRKDDAGAHSFRSVCRPGAVNFESADLVQGNTYQIGRERRVLNPDTAAQWLIAGLNAAQWGVKLQA